MEHEIKFKKNSRTQMWEVWAKEPTAKRYYRVWISDNRNELIDKMVSFKNDNIL